MRYATALARDELDYLCGAEYPLPDVTHDYWKRWRQTAGVVLKLADEEHPPPPGSTEEQLPAHILMLTVPRPYISTACETAHSLESAMVRHPDHRTELELWRDRMHGRCRLNNKFTGLLCSCPHHTEG
jgi:hypothetical protein